MSRRDKEQIRISITLDQAVHNKLDAAIPWGVKSRLLNALASEAMRVIEAEGPQAWGKIIEGEFHIALD